MRAKEYRKKPVVIEAVQWTGENIDITALHAALDAIEELNQTMTDENGHRWDRSDLIGQEIRAMRGIIRGAAESPRVINAFHPDVESYGLGWPQAECLIVSVQATDLAAKLAGNTLAKWLEQADGQPLSQECCEKLAHIIRSSVIEPARSILLAASQPAPALDVTGSAHDAHQIDLTTAGAQQAQEPVAVKVKPLEWDTVKAGDGSVWSVSVGLGLEYAVRIIPEIGWHWTKEYMPTWAPSESEEDAKAAAKADYEARIMAALDVQPLTVQDAATIERIASAMWKAEADRAAPNVGRYRTPEMFNEQSDETRKRWICLAHAALRAIAEGRA